MNSLIEDLYYGRCSPFERDPAQCPARDALEEQIATEIQYFTAPMCEADRRRFLGLEDLHTACAIYHELDAFACGLRLGARFMHAILEEDGEAAQPTAQPTAHSPA